ncbi:MAG: MlaD family protein [Planctomycetota bacterium]|jgi:hypothetical protein
MNAEPPAAVVTRRRRPSLVWLVPVLALALAGWLGYRAWALRGTVVLIQFGEGHGLRPGDEVRYRGITVGEVREVELGGDLEGVEVTASLHARADQLARGGARFWIVRPAFGLTSVEGIETIVGPRYLAVLPGPGPDQRRFVGLEAPPLIEAIDPGDLELIVESPRRGSLSRGGPVVYRQVRVGTVMSVGLSSDGGAVEARLHIEQPYAGLVRPETVFWDAGGLSARIGITGARLELDSLESVLRGAVALATPAEAGEPVRTGHRFRLEPDPPEEWIEWEPLVAIGSDLLPAGAPLPSPLVARIAWKQGFILKGRRSRHGWVLPTDAGLLGPADLLVPADKADEGSVVLEVAGEVLPLVSDPAWQAGGLALLAVDLDTWTWPIERRETPDAPPDCIAVADPTADPLPLAATRLAPGDRGWVVDQAVPVSEAWHGATVISRETGRLVGLLLVDDDGAVVAPVLMAE